MELKERKFRIRWRPVLLGAGTGMLTMICAAAGAAGLVANGVLGAEYLSITAAFALVGAGLTGSLAAQLGDGGPWESGLSALVELVVLFGLNGLLNGGQVEGVAVTALALAGGCGAGLLLELGQGRCRPRRRRKNRESAQKRRR